VLVVDTSALLAALLDDPRPLRLLERLSGEEFHAPHVVDIEFTDALRRLVATGQLMSDRAVRGRADFADLTIVRYPHRPLLDRMWELRRNLTAYDAAYVALSEALDAPLVTTDARLAAAPGHQAVVEAF
jgi:predicted nucleic acid-binding protein